MLTKLIKDAIKALEQKLIQTLIKVAGLPVGVLVVTKDRWFAWWKNKIVR